MHRELLNHELGDKLSPARYVRLDKRPMFAEIINLLTTIYLVQFKGLVSHQKMKSAMLSYSRSSFKTKGGICARTTSVEREDKMDFRAAP